MRRERDRYVGLVRVVQMVELLKREPWTAAQLGEELGISTRTAKRYLAVILRTGALDLRRHYEVGSGEHAVYRIRAEAA